MSLQLCAAEKESLEDACSYVSLSSEQIEALNSWGEPKKVCIGAGASSSVKNMGLVVHTAPFSKRNECLADISFEKEESSPPKKIIAERTVRSMGARN